MNILKKQKGASAIGIFIMLAIFGYAVFIGLQYIPLVIESGTVDSILDNIEQDNKTTPVQNVNEIKGSIQRKLLVNEMSDMKDMFHVTRKGASYTIMVSYERELNMRYGTKKIQYAKTRVLN